MVYLWVALGSAFGGVARHACGGLAGRLVGETFPWGTLFVNFAGSLIIGIIAAATVPDGRLLAAPDARAFILIGVLGGFTTFSSFSLETLNLARDGEWLWAGANVVLNVALCLIAVWVGHAGLSALSR